MRGTFSLLLFGGQKCYEIYDLTPVASYSLLNLLRKHKSWIARLISDFPLSTGCV